MELFSWFAWGGLACKARGRDLPSATSSLSPCQQLGEKSFKSAWLQTPETSTNAQTHADNATLYSSTAPFRGADAPFSIPKAKTSPACMDHTLHLHLHAPKLLGTSLKAFPLPSSPLHRSSRTRAINDCTAVGSSRPEIAARYRSASSRARDPDAPFSSSSHRCHSSTSSSRPPAGITRTCTHPRPRATTYRGQPGTETPVFVTPSSSARAWGLTPPELVLGCCPDQALGPRNSGRVWLILMPTPVRVPSVFIPPGTNKAALCVFTH